MSNSLVTTNVDGDEPKLCARSGKNFLEQRFRRIWCACRLGKKHLLAEREKIFLSKCLLQQIISSRSLKHYTKTKWVLHAKTSKTRKPSWNNQKWLRLNLSNRARAVCHCSDMPRFSCSQVCLDAAQHESARHDFFYRKSHGFANVSSLEIVMANMIEVW